MSSVIPFEKSYAIDQETGCWNWIRSRAKPSGYGILNRDGEQRAHRWAYKTFVGPVPEGMCVLHRCDNPPCVNPAHLWVGTQGDNVADMHAKGRAKKATGPMPWVARFGGDNVSRKYIDRMPRGEAVSTAKLTATQVLAIRAAHNDGAAQSELAREYCVQQTTISAIVTGKTWRHLLRQSFKP